MSHSTKSPEGQVADAVKDNWVDSLAPIFARPYLRLSRADRPIGTWLLYIPCIWGILLAAIYDENLQIRDAWLILASGVGAWLMRGAGCTWNDITDRDYDSKVARTRSRPIPSGQVTVPQAIVWMGFQAIIAFAILLSFGQQAVIMGITSLVFIAVYPFAKRFTWWPQVFLGLAFNWGALLGWVAHNGSLKWPAVVLYLSGVAWTLFYDTIYAYQDTKDDALIGVKSTARLFGEYGFRWLSLFLGLSVVLMATAIAMILPINSSIFWIAIIGPVLFGCHMAWQLSILDTNDSEILLRLFRAMRNVGFWPVIFFMIVALL